MAFASNLDVCDCLLQAVQKVCPQCNTIVHAMERCKLTAVGEPENTMKHRKVLYCLRKSY